MERRELLQIALGAAAPAPARFFTAEELRLVEDLTEMIIPADGHSGGARAAGVARYIDRRLAEEAEPEPKRLWREGLKPYLRVTAEERLALLTRAENNQEAFFKELKARTVFAYYTSKIGIHDDMEYKGNVYLKDFVGY
ncbi:MAG: gluconate 2-dehydrogenase subunit 3 family protein [Acidobacteria bacterium]|nr:gluconate 2-dehydrogenase subunit 3 family protein [Acidobacteriota bacterium]